MKLFRYKVGGAYQIRITEEIFRASQARMTNDLTSFPESEAREIQTAREEWQTLARERGLHEFDDSRFRATELFSIFMDALTQQMIANDVPEIVSYKHRRELPPAIWNQVHEAFEGFQIHERRSLARRVGDEPVFLSILSGMGRAIQELYTGKSEEMRDFETHVIQYIVGESKSAHKFLIKLLKKYGMQHEGLHQTILAIRDEMLLAELTFKGLNQ